jgi:hypothetical protein
MRTLSLLPEFALPYLLFGITVVALFSITRLLGGSTLSAVVLAAMLPGAQESRDWVDPDFVSELRQKSHKPRSESS